ncbi:MAG: AsmA family protein [Elusimicrobia bacterium]|nr:AsmA family protein [Elusimicrobiota bacterium]
MKVLKWLALGAAGAAALAVAALFVLKAKYPPEKLRALAISKIEPAVGRKLKIASVDLGLRGVRIGGLEISEAPDFSVGTFFKAERITAGWSLRALLERRIAISELSVSDFTCDLRRDASCATNVPAGQSPAPAPATKKKGKTAEEAAAAGLALTVNRVQLDGGTIHYRDADGTRAKIKKIEGRVSGIGSGPTLPVTLQFDYTVERGDSKWTGKAEAAGTVKPGETFELMLAPLKATFGKLEVKWDGTLTLSKKGLAATLAPLELEQSGIHLLLDGKLTRSDKGAVKLSAKGKLPALSADDLKRLGAAAAPSLTLPMGTAELEVGYDRDTVTLSPAIITLGPAKIDARGSVTLGGKSPGLDLKLKTTGVPIITLAPLVPILQTYLVLGKADLDLKVSGRADAPVLAGEGRIDDLAATINGFALRGGALKLTFDPKRLKAGLTGKLAGADLALDVDAKDYNTAPDVKVEGSLASLDLGPWAKAAEAQAEESPKPKSGKGADGKPGASGEAAKPLTTSGKLTVGPIKHPNFSTEGQTALAWDLRGITPGLANLHGKTTLRVGKGKFDDLDKLATKSETAKVVLLPFLMLQKVASLVKVPLFPAFDKVSFDEITGDYLFVKGVMTVKESHMDSSAGHVTTTGTANLGAKTLDLRMAAKIARVVAGPVAFFVRGSFADPKVTLDVAAVLKQPGLDKVIDKGLEEGKKLLQGIFK